MKQFLKDRDVRSFTRRHTALLGFVASLLLFFGTITYVAIESGKTHHALCVLRGDLEQRIEASTRFLQQHPNGIPGIPLRTIRDGINNQRRTVKALRSLNC